jgi:hypothetical protein
MSHSMKLPLLCLGAVLTISAGAPAAASEWSRETAHGGEISRSVTGDGGVYSGSTTRTGPKGGTYSSSSTCAGGVVTRCSRSYSGVGPNGKSFSGTRASAHGPFHTRSAGSFTGPGGNTIFGFRRFRR